MGDYDLTGLSTRSFERLIQSLASKVLGPGLVVFGDGPDGGREATFEGRVPFPSTVDPWDGYCVVQAKFRQRPVDPKRDFNWALKQLEKELKDFLDVSKRRRPPEYYIFATNLVLTPASKSGGKDRFAALMNKYRRKLKLRDWRVWDFDQITTFLDGNSDVRHAYTAWITPGDVLAQAMQNVKVSRVDFLDVITNFLAKDLLSDQFANLGQAGHTSDQKVPLAHVFVDLPTTPGRLADPPDEDQGPGVIELVCEIINTASHRLDPSATSQSEDSPKSIPLFQEPEPGRYVLVGGPGQGKTTVSQFACQLFRTSILRDRPPHLLPPEVKQVIANLLHQCEAQGPHLPRARRFPVRIVLNSFAAALKAAIPKRLSLLDYIAQNIEDVTGYPIPQGDLRNWLGAYPWLIVLDGLDEVPPSTNRDDVLKSVRDFWVDAAQLNADVLVLATTRPQGYNDDFSPTLYRHLWLVPLSAKRALHYADRLVESRWGHDKSRREKVMSHLARASSEEATARLMRSPLQVTIMATLVDQIGPPPQDRWRLFHLYYDVIYRREQERDIPAAELLRNHRADIDAIHSYVALVLQIESERAGGTEARLSHERLARVVTVRLENEGQMGDSLTELREQIIDAAANRLVFLVGLQEGQVGFEIRSLQEFMAAEALIAGNDTEVQVRLGHIAPIPSWRNVFLFAAGRCYAQDQHRRDTVTTICAWLNTEHDDPLARTVLSGSGLALELLEEAIARRQPKYARLLADLAVKIIDLPPSDLHGRLADVMDEQSEDIYKQALSKGLQRDFSFQLGAWATLFSLMARGIPWSRDLSIKSPPIELLQTEQLFELAHTAKADTWLQPQIERYLSSAPPKSFLTKRMRMLRPRFKSIGGDPLAKLDLDHDDRLDPSFEKVDGVKLFITSINRRISQSVVVPNHPDWQPTAQGIAFSHAPSRVALAQTLEAVLRSDSAFPAFVPEGVPWVFTSCLRFCQSRGDLEYLIPRVKEGDLGDVEDWLMAEARWRAVGIKVQDLNHPLDPRLPFDKCIGHVGIPTVDSAVVFHRASEQFEAFLVIYNQLANSPRVRQIFGWVIPLLLSRLQPRKPPPSLSPRMLEEMMASQDWQQVGLGVVLIEWCHDDPAWLRCLDLVGKARVLTEHTIDDNAKAMAPNAVRKLFNLHRSNQSLTGLLRFIQIAIRNGVNAPRLHVRAEDFDEPVIKRAALVIELSQGVTSERAGELAQLGVALSRDENIEVFQEVVDALIRQGSPEPIIADFLLFAYGYLEHEHGNGAERTSILHGIQDILRRRKSDLSERSVWNSLSLPPSLLDAFSEDLDTEEVTPMASKKGKLTPGGRHRRK